jgi:pimeloyl-ACP methyl ester carboxylesterase
VSTYLLIHGAWHGGWCWDKTVSLLERAGHRAVAPDLPGHGVDPTPIARVTQQAYVARVCDAIEVQGEPVILVGHSMGGVIVTQAAEECSQSLEALVYLAAFLPSNGESLADWARRDTKSLVAPNRTFSEDRSYSTIRREALKEVFYGGCSDEDVARAAELLRPQATAPSPVPVRITEENFGSIPRVYIETLRDRAVTPWLQKQMYTATSCRRVISMDTAHSPFLSAPEELVAHLLSVRDLTR